MPRPVTLEEAPEVRRIEQPRERMPIEELARRTGMTVRNLRAMQARDLLEPPELVGRKGFYTERHEARVFLLLKLQSRGFSLAAIQAMIKGWNEGSGLMDVMGLEDALMTRGVPGQATEADVAQAFPELLANPRALAKALQQELVVKRDGRIVAPNAELLSIVKQQVDAGFPLEVVLDNGDALLEDLDRIATRFRQSFFDHIVNPLFGSDPHGQALTDVATKVALLRPLSVRLVSILLARAIERGGGPIAPPPPEKPARTPAKSAAKAPKKGKR